MRSRHVHFIACATALGISSAAFAVATLVPVATIPYPAVQSPLIDPAGNIYLSANNGVMELSGPGYATSTSLANGIEVPSQLTADSGGNIYGTALLGGPQQEGSVFELSGAGHQVLTTLTTFKQRRHLRL